MTPEAARNEIADMAVQAAIHAVKYGAKPEGSGTLKIFIEVAAPIVEAAARETD